MGFLLLFPFFLIRFGLLSLLNKDAVRRAAFFAPLQAGEKIAYVLYQLANAAILIDLLFLPMKRTPAWLFFSGLATYAVGLLLLSLSVVHFAAPAPNDLHQNGLYRLSRNPMYVAYFVFFIGCVLLTQSRLLLVFVLLFQVTAHWIIRSEERWCIQRFGQAYLRYMEKVRRYL